MLTSPEPVDTFKMGSVTILNMLRELTGVSYKWYASVAGQPN